MGRTAKNKAGNTANTSCGRVHGWAGAEMRVSTLFDLCSRTDGRTDGQTDKGSFRVAFPQLKSIVILI